MVTMEFKHQDLIKETGKSHMMWSKETIASEERPLVKLQWCLCFSWQLGIAFLNVDQGRALEEVVVIELRSEQPEF